MNALDQDGLITQHRQSWFSGVVSLLASSSTLVCCAIPALLVTLGAGAALSSFVAVFPQIVWLSEHKLLVFGVAIGLIIVAGWMQWRSRYAPCPAEPELRDLCLRTRKISLRIYMASLLCLVTGVFFAFIAPRLAGL